MEDNILAYFTITAILLEVAYMTWSLPLLLLGLLGTTWACGSCSLYTEERAKVFLETTGDHAKSLWSAVTYATWNNYVNTSEATQAAVVRGQIAL